MTEQKEYNEFVEKFTKNVLETKKDFNNLSDENKAKFASEAYQILKSANFVIGVEQLKHFFKQRHF